MTSSRFQILRIFLRLKNVCTKKEEEEEEEEEKEKEKKEDDFEDFEK